MNGALKILGTLQGFLAGGCAENDIADTLQIFRGHLAKRFGVFRKQNGFRAFEYGRFDLYFFEWLMRLLDAREVDLEGSALTEFAVYPDISAGLLHNSVNGG